MSRRPRSIAINVGANTNLPGIRGPVYPDGRFEYLPIPEEQPTRRPVPTYGDLAVDVDLPEDVRDTPVHLDPEFAEYPTCERYSYGDDHGVKAGPLSELEAGDFLLFYATLTFHGDPDEAADWIASDWGAYLVGEFRVARAITGETYETLSADERAAFDNNAHVKRDPVDAKVLVEGDDSSRLYEYAVPLSSPDAGATANRLVTALSNDSGKGPWWRRRLWYDAHATAELRDVVERWPNCSLG
ncbi:hypothetical protein SAMN04487948_12449 [Halogranum amylolyticum]|uniref:Nucleotide modification associated domain-containing protein n=1 Tax=Halogranum amylolyticum TaxID=660520 RepID=A0A1H8W6M4_9EURY|nr:hypothetical protein [Halogranum amylolyticum]SEP23305.1 hypothetical protein SAMN04487948_12449 [Halogranum amylolyticum]